MGVERLRHFDQGDRSDLMFLLIKTTDFIRVVEVTVVVDRQLEPVGDSSADLSARFE